MKKLLLGLLCCFALSSYAQDTIKKTNSVGKFEEQFTVLKSDKKVRQGSYQLLTDKKVVASGRYEHGKRAGVWSFYNEGVLEQQYDYNANKLLMNLQAKAITTEVEDSAPGDSIKTAVKIGGYNGFKFLVASTDFEQNIDAGRNQVTHALVIDDKGEIKSWVASVKNADGMKVVTQKIVDVPVDVMMFLPATVNGKAVTSTVSFNSEMKGMTPQGGFDTNNRPKKRGGRG